MGQVNFNEYPDMDRSFEFVRDRCSSALLHQIFILVFIVSLDGNVTCMNDRFELF